MKEPEVKCSLCGVSVPVSKIDTPDRCGDKRCPLNKKDDIK